LPRATESLRLDGDRRNRVPQKFELVNSSRTSRRSSRFARSRRRLPRLSRSKAMKSAGVSCESFLMRLVAG
jgi:hypothetical protein